MPYVFIIGRESFFLPKGVCYTYFAPDIFLNAYTGPAGLHLAVFERLELCLTQNPAITQDVASFDLQTYSFERLRFFRDESAVRFILCVLLFFPELVQILFTNLRLVLPRFFPPSDGRECSSFLPAAPDFDQSVHRSTFFLVL